MSGSELLSPTQMRGLIKAGEVILPGTERSPSFAATGCAAHFDRMGAFLSPDDLGGLKILLTLLAFCPAWAIALLMTLATHNRKFPGFVGAGLRMLELGLKGAVVSLYYSDLTGPGYEGPRVFEAIGYDARVNYPGPR